MKVVFIGAGNLATSLAKALDKDVYNVIHVYSRTEESAKSLARILNTNYTTDLSLMDVTADIYIFSVKDSALESVINNVETKNALCLHTAGSISLSVFKDKKRAGVLYPLQTFSKTKEVDWQTTPLFIESKDERDFQIIKTLADSLSKIVYPLSSADRKYVHLTGVFASNFANHMFTISEQMLAKIDLPFTVVLPIINETCMKVHEISPREAQTGPALRNDKNVMDFHLDLIEDENIRDIYKAISENIYKTNKKYKI